ncbi:hypothetical protein ZIOFF_008805 [Zingiber officinale]|uniref:Amine oxidase domain-containing protein n=1 Tax=Zingiber officinale TaxID=94328 RepID=A0A8J5LU08_ZINOF|nr:hypothetical protein ZIOFF_008805 [Zingiber officinale]
MFGRYVPVPLVFVISLETNGGSNNNLGKVVESGQDYLHQHSHACFAYSRNACFDMGKEIHGRAIFEQTFLDCYNKADNHQRGLINYWDEESHHLLSIIWAVPNAFASIKVVLLESRDRIGGRVHTNYSFGFPVDMGAASLHGVCNENPLASWIGRLGLPIYRTSGDNSVLYDHDLERYETNEDMSIAQAIKLVMERHSI